MESNKVKYLDRYALPLSEAKLKKRSTWNGWIWIILTQQIKSRRDTVSALILQHLEINIIYMKLIQNVSQILRVQIYYRLKTQLGWYISPKIYVEAIIMVINLNQ